MLHGELNHNHLLYFWMTASEGSIARASESLNVTPQTISSQIKLLEDAFDVRLFERDGRGLRLTEAGRTVKAYADEIFSLSRELQAVLRGGPEAKPAELRVGVSDVLPKLVCQRLLEPVLHMPGAPRLVVREDGIERLLAELSLHNLDMVLADAPIPHGLHIRAYNHLLGQCGVVLMASPKLAGVHGKRFPAGLHDAPFLLPTQDTALRRSLMFWFEEQGIDPTVVAEIADSGLLKTFGERGLGVFPVAEVVAKDLAEHSGMVPLGLAEGVVERFFAITAERRIRHPALVELSRHAKDALFSAP